MRIRFLFKNLRHRSREYLGWLLARLVGNRQVATSLAPQEVSSVLICRINGRIGNTLFVTPLIRYLHELLPNAAIDLALAYPQAEELLRGMPGVRRIIVFPHRQPQMIGRYLAALRRLRACRYDLAIDPTEFSTSGRVMLALARSRFRLGFASSAQWAPLTHAVPLPRQAMHQAVRPLYLPHRIFGAPFEPRAVRLWLPLPESELAQGRRAIAQAIGVERMPTPSNAFGFFAHAANLKIIDRSWWLSFWEAFLAMEPQALPVEFLPSPTQPPTDERFASLHLPFDAGAHGRDRRHPPVHLDRHRPDAPRQHHRGADRGSVSGLGSGALRPAEAGRSRDRYQCLFSARGRATLPAPVGRGRCSGCRRLNCAARATNPIAAAAVRRARRTH